MTDPYASEEESKAVMVREDRSPYKKMLDEMLEVYGANEQGAEPYPILYEIATNLLFALYHEELEKR